MLSSYPLSSPKNNIIRAETFSLWWLFAAIANSQPAAPSLIFLHLFFSANFHFQLSFLSSRADDCVLVVRPHNSLCLLFFLILYPAPVGLFLTRCRISGAKTSSAGSPWGMPAPVPGATSFPPFFLTPVLSLLFLSLLLPPPLPVGCFQS